MNKKLPMKETMKPIIEALRGGKKSWSDLKKLTILEKHISDATLYRLLKYLEHWDLAKKEDDYWVWHENVRVFSSKAEYEIAIDHSKNLFTKFRPLLQYSAHFKASEPTIYSAGREHLKSYPEIYRRLEKYEKAFAVLSEKMLQNKKLLAQHKVDAEIAGPFEFHEFYDKWNPTTTKEAELKDALGKELKSFFDVYRPFAEDISLIETSIEHGRPLDGTCPLCPKVRITD